MPYKLYGNYYTFKDLKTIFSLTDFILKKWISEAGVEEIKVGRSILFDQKGLDKLKAYAEELEILKTHMTVRDACNALGCEVEELTAKEFIPCQIVRGSVMYAIDHIHQIKEACKPKWGRRVDWAKAETISWVKV